MQNLLKIKKKDKIENPFTSSGKKNSFFSQKFLPSNPLSPKFNNAHQKNYPTAMKIPTRILSGAALFAVALTSAYSQTATTKPVGYRTEVIKGGNVFNLLSPNLDNAVGASGTFESAAGAVLTDDQGTFTTAFTAGTALTLKITSGANAGITQDVTAFTATTVTTGQDISGLVTAGTSYELRATPTVASLFGATNSAGLLGSASNSNTADLIWIPNGDGTYTRIFYSTGGIQGTGWRAPGIASTDRGATPIAITDAVFVQRKGTTDLSVVFTGHVQTTATKAAVVNGFNPVSRVIPVGITLAQSQLETELTQSASNSNTADLIWNPTGTGNYDRYFYSNGGIQGTGWRSPGIASTDRGSVVLNSGYLIQRKGNSTNVTLRLPTGLDL